MTLSTCRIKRRLLLILEPSLISGWPVWYCFTERSDCKLVGIFNGVRRDVSPESDTYPGSDLGSSHCVKKPPNKRRKTQLLPQRSPPSRRHTHRCPPVTFTLPGGNKVRITAPGRSTAWRAPQSRQSPLAFGAARSEEDGSAAQETVIARRRRSASGWRELQTSHTVAAFDAIVWRTKALYFH